MVVGASLESVRYSVGLFAGLKQHPRAELSSLPWEVLVEAIAPEHPPIVGRKDKHRTSLRRRCRKRRSFGARSIGLRNELADQESGDRATTSGPAGQRLALDIDVSPVFELEPILRALGCAAVMYTS